MYLLLHDSMLFLSLKFLSGFKRIDILRVFNQRTGITLEYWRRKVILISPKNHRQERIGLRTKGNELKY
jgi:hypothetical protein